MSGPIKLPSLADIPNPHPVMLVGDRHGIYRDALCVAQSIEPLKEQGYETLFDESTGTDSFIQLTKLIKGQGDFAYRNNFHLLGRMATYLQATAVGMKFICSDMKGKRGGEEHAALQKANDTQFQQAVDEMIGLTLQPLLIQTPDQEKAMLQLLAFAYFGEKAFERLHTRIDLSSDAKSALYKTGAKWAQLFTEKEKRSHDYAEAEIRDLHMAQVIAEDHIAFPQGKKISYNGCNHICRTVKGRSSVPPLSEVLLEKYSIACTSVIFAYPYQINEVKKSLDALNLRPGDVSVDEVDSYMRDTLNANPVETFFALSGKDIAQGVHDVRKVEALPLDYAIILPNISNQDALAHLEGKIDSLIYR